MNWAAALKHYLKLRTDLEGSLYDGVARELRKLRDAKDEASRLVHALIGARLAVKTQGNLGRGETTLLSAEKVTHPYLKAETYFVRGLVHYHLGSYADGEKDFRKAERLFSAETVQDPKRALISRYNAYCGTVNTGGLDGPVERQKELQILHRAAVGLDHSHIIGVVLRDRSALYQELGRSNAALADARKSVSLLELHGPKSDLDLSLVQLADCELDLGRTEQARALIERVIDPVDQRVAMILSVVNARLEDKPVELPSDNEGIWPGLRWKFERARKAFPAAAKKGTGTLKWDQEKGKLWLADGSTIPLRANSLEGKLLRQLIKTPSTKEQLIEALWPERADNRDLDNRFFQLLHRLNKKLGQAIHFDGNRYRASLS